MPVEAMTHTKKHTDRRDQISQMADEVTLLTPLTTVALTTVPLTTVPLAKSFGDGHFYDNCLSGSDLASRRQTHNSTIDFH